MSEQPPNLYTANFLPGAERKLRKMAEPHRSEIWSGIRTLEREGPFPKGKNVRVVAGKRGFYRFRFGKYRIEYSVDFSARVIVIIQAGQKKDIVY